jgi:hypothetical protein
VDRVSTDLDARKASIHSGRAGQEKAPRGGVVLPGLPHGECGGAGGKAPALLFDLERSFLMALKQGVT